LPHAKPAVALILDINRQSEMHFGALVRALERRLTLFVEC